MLLLLLLVFIVQNRQAGEKLAEEGGWVLGMPPDFPMPTQTEPGGEHRGVGKSLGQPALREGGLSSPQHPAGPSSPQVSTYGGRWGEEWLSCFRQEAITFLERASHGPSEAGVRDVAGRDGNEIPGLPGAS